MLGQVVDSKYLIVEKLSEGGMGRVYKARHTETEEIVCIKFLHEFVVADEYQERFLREAKILASLSHPNIGKFYGYGQGLGTEQYIVMEYIPGVPLCDLLSPGERLSVETVLRIGSQVCDALQYLHESGVVHRDLKPANIMVPDASATATNGLAKVIDFGLARTISPDEPSLTQSGRLIGTVYYMSPEQCLGKRATPESDVYALGCILFEMLSGQRTFLAEHPVVVMQNHVQVPCPRLIDLSEDLPVELSDLVEKMLSKVPQARPSIALVKTALQDLSSTADIHLVTHKRQRPARTWNVACGAMAITLLLSFCLWQFSTNQLTKKSPTHTSRSNQGTRVPSFQNYVQMQTSPEVDSARSWLEAINASDAWSDKSCPEIYDALTCARISEWTSATKVLNGLLAYTDELWTRRSTIPDKEVLLLAKIRLSCIVPLSGPSGCKKLIDEVMSISPRKKWLNDEKFDCLDLALHWRSPSEINAELTDTADKYFGAASEGWQRATLHARIATCCLATDPHRSKREANLCVDQLLMYEKPASQPGWGHIIAILQELFNQSDSAPFIKYLQHRRGLQPIHSCALPELPVYLVIATGLAKTGSIDESAKMLGQFQMNPIVCKSESLANSCKQIKSDLDRQRKSDAIARLHELTLLTLKLKPVRVFLPGEDIVHTQFDEK